MGDERRQSRNTPDVPTASRKICKNFFWGVGGSGSEIRLYKEKEIKIKIISGYMGENFFFKSFL
jgi:hypothetical protein